MSPKRAEEAINQLAPRSHLTNAMSCQIQIMYPPCRARFDSPPSPVHDTAETALAARSFRIKTRLFAFKGLTTGSVVFVATMVQGKSSATDCHGRRPAKVGCLGQGIRQRSSPRRTTIVGAGLPAEDGMYDLDEVCSIQKHPNRHVSRPFANSSAWNLFC